MTGGYNIAVVYFLAKEKARVQISLPAQMILLSIFTKMRLAIKKRVVSHEPGLYVYILFPIAFTFLLTFVGARILNIFAPNFYILWFGIHAHHFTYGFFILAAAGYLALIHSGPRAKFFIALLHGFGLGLAMDEFGMWLHLTEEESVRLSYDGFNMVIAVFLLILTAKPGFRMLKNHLPLGNNDVSGGS